MAAAITQIYRIPKDQKSTSTNTSFIKDVFRVLSPQVLSLIVAMI